MMGIVARGGLGVVTVVGGCHKNVMIHGVTGDNGADSGRWGKGPAELGQNKGLACASQSLES